MADEKKDVNSIAYDAPLSFKDPGKIWRLHQQAKGLDRKKLQLPAVDLSGKWVVISGSNNGIGRDAALQFAAWGANMILACRDPPPHESHPEIVVAECRVAARRAGHTASQVEWWELDCAKVASIEAFCERWLATGRTLDILCNNAGLGASPVSTGTFKTEDGFEIIHQVNFLSHVLITLRLLPSLAKAAAPRIVCTTSCFHLAGRFDLRNFNGELGNTGPEGVHLYQNNKLWYQVWLTELQRRMLQHDQYKHITVNGVHPGYVNSGIWKLGGPQKQGWLVAAKETLLKVMVMSFGISTQQGSLAILNGATQPAAGPDPEVQGVGEKGGRGGGRYFNRIWEATVMPHARDPDCRARVWRKVNDELKLQEKGLLDVLGVKYEEGGVTLRVLL